MVKFLHLLTIFNLFLLSTTETSLEIEVANHLTLLEDQTYFPINVYLSGLATQLETLITNFSNYELDAAEVIHTYTDSIKEDVLIISETLEETGVDIQPCEEHIHENFKQIVRNSLTDSKIVVLDGITKAQRIISEAKNVFMAAQNRTLAVKLKIQNCMLLVDSTECLFEALGMTVLLERTLPKIIAIVGQQHEIQLTLLEDEIVADLEKIVVQVFDSHVELLDEFLVCVLQWD